MKRAQVLLVDALINFILGVLLVTFPLKIVKFLGIPETPNKFYPSILGAVLIGIAIALFLEYFRKPTSMVGLGLGGAVLINLCAGLVLIGWLVSGKLNIPFHGQVILWILVLVLITISGVELAVHSKR
jgi:hypothetical protein